MLICSPFVFNMFSYCSPQSWHENKYHVLVLFVVVLGVGGKGRQEKDQKGLCLWHNCDTGIPHVAIRAAGATGDATSEN